MFTATYLGGGPCDGAFNNGGLPPISGMGGPVGGAPGGGLGGGPPEGKGGIPDVGGGIPTIEGETENVICSLIQYFNQQTALPSSKGKGVWT